MTTQLDSPKVGGARRMWSAVSALVLMTLGALLIDRLVQVQARLDQLEAIRLDETRSLHWNLDGVQRELATVRYDLGETEAKALAASDLSNRIESAESRIGDIGNAMEAHASTLSELESHREAFGPEVLEQQLAKHDERRQEEYESLSRLISHTQADAQATRVEIDRLESEIGSKRDLSVMWRELLGPVVQIAGDMSVGSGILLQSTRDDEAKNYRTYLMTAWHVIRDIQGDLSKTDMPVPVFIYSEDGEIDRTQAQLLAFDAGLDSALLELRTDVELKNGATLATRKHLSDIRIFDEIYAVGCPLGNDPIPTRGEISTLSHSVDGESYWMINAPTYIGNSGGGIFDSRTHELLGIFSKIYTHGTLRPTIVPHMGLVTPLAAIYDWLEKEGYGDIIPSDDARSATARVASAEATDEPAPVDSLSDG